MTKTYHQKLLDSMQGELENDEITIKLYHYTDDEYKVYDTDSIKVEFENKLNVLEVKNAVYYGKQDKEN
jgi:hypothetical protein